MTRIQGSFSNKYKVLIVDDQQEALSSSKELLESRGYKAFTAQSGNEAIEILKNFSDFDILLLDFFMPEMSGEEVVREIREFNKSIFIILNTGYSGEKPPLEMMHKLNIQAYHNKSDGPDKLLLWLSSAEKQIEQIKMIKKQEHGFEFILNSANELFKIQKTENLFIRVLDQITNFIRFSQAFICIKTSSGHYSSYGMGKYNNKSWEDVKNSEIKQIIASFAYSSSITFDENLILMPILDVDGTWLGIIILEDFIIEDTLLFQKLMKIFLSIIAISIHNTWNIQDLKSFDIS